MKEFVIQINGGIMLNGKCQCKKSHVCEKDYVWNPDTHCVKGARIRSYSRPYFPAFRLDVERYSVSLRIQSECGKIQTRITPDTDTFQAVTCNCENGKCLPSIMDDSGIIFDETIESYEQETNFIEKKQPIKHKISIFCLHFY